MFKIFDSLFLIPVPVQQTSFQPRFRKQRKCRICGSIYSASALSSLSCEFCKPNFNAVVSKAFELRLQ